MKKLISLILAFAMVFSLAMPAMAAEDRDVTASYTPVITISGVTISEHTDFPGAVAVDETNKTYTVTIPADATEVYVNINVSGQNLDKFPDESTYWVKCGSQSYPMAVGYDPNIGNVLIPIEITAVDIGTADLQYSTDGGTNWTDTGWNVVVQQAEPAPTKVSLKAKLKAVDSTGAAIAGEVYATLDGTSVNNTDITEYNVIFTGNKTMTWATIPSGYQTPADVSLTVTDTDGDGVGELTSNSDHATVGTETIDGETVYVITVTLAEETVTPGPAATISGVSITVDGTEYTSGNVTITPDSEVTLTVTGTNLQNGTQDNVVEYADGYATFVASGYFDFNEDGTSATKTISADIFDTSNNFEIKFTNDGEQNWTNTGIYVTYDDGSTAVTYDVNIAEPTNGDVSTDKQTAAAGETVTLTVTPDADYQIGTVTVTDAEGKTVAFTETGVVSGIYKFTMPASAVTVEATFTAIEKTSADIVWGSLAYTYTDEAGEWSAGTADGAGTVTVTNNGATAITATPAYTSTTTDYGTITGSFDVASAELGENESKTFKLSLNGTPTKAIPTGTKIGSVTVTIEEVAEPTPFSFSIDNVEYTAMPGMTWGEWVDSEYNTSTWYVAYDARDARYYLVFYDPVGITYFVSRDGTNESRVFDTDTIDAMDYTCYEIRD